MPVQRAAQARKKNFCLRQARQTIMQAWTAQNADDTPILYSTAPAASSLPRAMPADLPGLHCGGGLEERLVRLHRVRNRHRAEPVKVEALDIRHGVKDRLDLGRRSRGNELGDGPH